MDVGIIVREYLVGQNRDAVDRAAADTSIHSNEIVKTLVLLANGKLTAVFAPRNVIVNCFLSSPEPTNPKAYSYARAIGWLAFVGFVITVGQASCVMQLAIVVVTISATVLTARRVGTENDGVGKTLQVARLELPSKDGTRDEAYAMLDLSGEEEDTMVDWSLFPRRQKKEWWDQYRAYQKDRSDIVSIDEDISTEKEPVGIPKV